jgi:DNA (cytosine-5)-methyltransferase 1
MSEAPDKIFDHQGGTTAPWYEGRTISDEKREFFRERALKSRASKLRADRGEHESIHPVNVPAFNPAALMPQLEPNGLAALSLFSGGGGLDLGFALTGYSHVASYDTLAAAGETLKTNRPDWKIFAGDAGDVRGIDWRHHRGEVSVIHGGPPCQPFSAAGRQRGSADDRNMLPEFVRAVEEISPAAFVAENVPALAGPKFAPYLQKAFVGPLSKSYQVVRLRLSAHEFGVPQVRHRVFFIGFRQAAAARRFLGPVATHRADHLHRGPAPPLVDGNLLRTPGAREALGLKDMGVDALAPTLRSTLTGPRHTTSVLSSASAQRVWAAMGIWPNGVSPTREAASAFPPENGHFRLSVPDCALLQGFPSSWTFTGATYMALGQIGNSVAPPVSYAVAAALAKALTAPARR